MTDETHNRLGQVYNAHGDQLFVVEWLNPAGQTQYFNCWAEDRPHAEDYLRTVLQQPKVEIVMTYVCRDPDVADLWGTTHTIRTGDPNDP